MSNLSPFCPALPRMTMIPNPSSFFANVKSDFQSFYKSGYYYVEKTPGYYIHRVQTKFRSYTGIVAFISIEDYLSGNIVKHEHTINEKENKTNELFEKRKSLIKPVLLTYPNVMEIDALTNRLTFSIKPSLEFDIDTEHHTFWHIDQPHLIERYTQLFKEKVAKTYIADGHHRTSTTARKYLAAKETGVPEEQNPSKHLFVELFAVSEIEIHNYNRLLVKLEGHTGKSFLEKLTQSFLVEKAGKSVKPDNTHIFGMYLNKNWYKLTVKPEIIKSMPDAFSLLDAQLFNQLIMKEILGVEDIRHYPNIDYLEGPKGTGELTSKVDKKQAMAAFNLFPLPIEDMIAISDQGGVLPPKSTYFFPRSKSGVMAQLH